MAEREPNEAEMAEFARQMQEQLRSLTAADLLSQTGITLVNVAAARLGMVDGVPDDDPAEARAAIDALADLIPVLERHAPGPLLDELRAGLAQLRLAFVELAGGPGAGAPEAGGGAGGEGPAGGSQPPPPPRPPRPEEPRPRIWTPGGDR
jgi:hypothetical protein